MKRSKKDIIQNIIILILLLASPVLFSLFIGLNFPTHAKSEAVFDRLWIVGNSAESIDYDIRASLALPIAIAYKNDDLLLAAYANDTLISTIYTEFDNVITDIFGKESKISESGLNASAAAALLDDSSGLIYFKYASPLPYPVICACALGSEAVSSDFSEAPSIYVEAIALLTEDDGEKTTARVLIFGMDGKIYESTAKNGDRLVISYADTAYLDAYSDSFSKAEFIFNDGSAAPFISAGAIAYSELKCTSYPEIFGENAADLPEIFGMNPEKTSSYIDHNNTTVFVSSSASLKLTAEGEVFFDSESGGELSFKKLLGYSKPGKGRYDLFDMLNAAVKFTELLNDSFPELSDSSVLRITAFSKDESGLVIIELSKYNNGIRIDTAPYRLTFGRNGLVSAVFGCTRFEALPERFAALPLGMIYKRLTSKSETVNWIEPIYTKAEAAGDTYTLSFAVG